MIHPYVIGVNHVYIYIYIRTYVRMYVGRKVGKYVWNKSMYACMQ